MQTLTPSLLAWLRAFEAVARYGSVTRAAGELHVSQGAVSQQVKQLELALGFSLFARRGPALELTPEGRKLAPTLETAFGSIREALGTLTAPGGLVPVTLSCSPSFAMRWLSHRLKSPPPGLSNIDLRVFGEFHHLDRNRMAAESLEAAVRYDAIEYGDLSAEPFLDEYLIAVATAETVERHAAQVRAGALDGRALLHDTRPWHGAREDEEWAMFARAAGIAIRDPEQGKRYNLSQLAIDAALGGEGIAIGRLALVLDDLRTGRLVPLLPVAVRSTASYKFISVRDRPPRIAALGRWLAEEAKHFVAERDAALADMKLMAITPTH